MQCCSLYSVDVHEFDHFIWRLRVYIGPHLHTHMTGEFYANPQVPIWKLSMYMWLEINTSSYFRLHLGKGVEEVEEKPEENMQGGLGKQNLRETFFCSVNTWPWTVKGWLYYHISPLRQVSNRVMLFKIHNIYYFVEVLTWGKKRGWRGQSLNLRIYLRKIRGV